MPISLLIHPFSTDGACSKASVIGKHGILGSLTFSFSKICFASNPKKVEGTGVVERT